jgi:D-xylulose reductase
MTRSGGRVVAVGMHTAPVSVPVHTIHNLTVVGSQIGYRTHAAVFRRAMDLLAEGKFRTGPLITHRFAFEEAAEAYRLLDERPAEALGVILRYPPGD